MVHLSCITDTSNEPYVGWIPLRKTKIEQSSVEWLTMWWVFHPTFRAFIVSKKTKITGTIWNNSLGGVSSSFWRNQPTKNQQVKCSAALCISFCLHGLRITSSPCNPRQHGQPGRWEWPSRSQNFGCKYWTNKWNIHLGNLWDIYI